MSFAASTHPAWLAWCHPLIFVLLRRQFQPVAFGLLIRRELVVWAQLGVPSWPATSGATSPVARLRRPGFHPHWYLSARVSLMA
jgi:hypothetical protein